MKKLFSWEFTIGWRSNFNIQPGHCLCIHPVSHRQRCVLTAHPFHFYPTRMSRILPWLSDNILNVIHNCLIVGTGFLPVFLFLLLNTCNQYRSLIDKSYRFLHHCSEGTHLLLSHDFVNYDTSSEWIILYKNDRMEVWVVGTSKITLGCIPRQTSLSKLQGADVVCQQIPH